MRRSIRKLLLVVVSAFSCLCALVVGQSPAQAQSCSFSIPDLDFGDVDLTLGTSFDLTANLSITCTGSPWRFLRYCANIGGGTGGHLNGDPRYMLNGANQLAYNIYSNAGFSTVWGSAFWPYSNPPFGFAFLNGTGTYSGTFPVRVRIAAGQTTLPNGLYQSSFAGSHTLFAYKYFAFGQNCNSIGTSNGVRVPFTVRANNIGGCAVSANDLNFGTLSQLSANSDAMTTVSVRCTSGVGYQVGLNGGLTGAADPTQRKMVSGANQITYGLYQNAARSIPWGDTLGSNTATGTGTGIAQSLTVYGRIPPQTTPPAATYTDTIVVTVTY